MINVAFKGLAARRLRTALTALAIVLGVAMVSAAFTITDTMRGAADSLSSAAYDGTDAVVGARTSFDVDAGDWTAKRPTVDARLLEQVRAVPGVEVAAGDVTDEAKIIKRDGKPAGDGPYFGVGFDAKTKGAERLSPFRLESGRWAAGPGEVVLDAATAEDQDYGLGSTVPISIRGEALDFNVVGIARFGSVKSLGTVTSAVFDLRAAQELFDRGGKVDGILVGGRDGVPAAQTAGRPRGGAAGRAGGQRAEAGPLHARRPGGLHLDHPDRAAGVRRRGDPGRRVHDLQHALDHRRAAHA
jgi:putative ABC transport system permease protein